MSKKTHSQDSNFEPKIAPLGSCYNYNKLKKEGLVSEEKSFEEVWREMDAIDPLTPSPADPRNDDDYDTWDYGTEPIPEDHTWKKESIEAYREAAKSDAFLFGDYDAFQAYGIKVEEG